MEQSSDISRFIANKIRGGKGKGFSVAVYRVAVWSVAAGIAIMILSVSILGGFRDTIQQKIASLGAHLTISRYDRNNSFDDLPIPLQSSLTDSSTVISSIAAIQPFARKSALLKSETELTGILFKGLGMPVYAPALAPLIVKGGIPNWASSSTSPSVDIWVSNRIAQKLNIEWKDSLLLFFVQDPPRIRKVFVAGIFETGLDEFDEQYILGDLNLVKQMNGWKEFEVGGYEVYLHDFNLLNPVADSVFEAMEYNLQIEKVTDQYIQLFDWLELLRRNVVIFVLLIAFVAVFNVGSSLLVMVMERTHMIGMLKAVGGTDGQIGRIFYLNGLRIVGKGLLIGNSIALTFCVLQYYFEWIPLDVENYYMHTVPIAFDWLWILLLNCMLALVVGIVLWVPTWVVGRIRPIVSIRFD
jgi:lipoprotein-releasing system permease protein